MIQLKLGIIWRLRLVVIFVRCSLEEYGCGYFRSTHKLNCYLICISTQIPSGVQVWEGDFVLRWWIFSSWSIIQVAWVRLILIRFCFSYRNTSPIFYRYCTIWVVGKYKASRINCSRPQNRQFFMLLSHQIKWGLWH